MPVTDEPHSARKKGEGAEIQAETEGNRGHVNRYMLETHEVFIAVVMHRAMGEFIWRKMW